MIRRRPFFQPEAADRARMPVALLTGFLGSGKTTLVNALLRDPRLARTAVAVNEFGAIPLDQHLIDHGADKTVVMANGCLCCNLAGDLEDAVLRIFSRRQSGDIPSFDRLIIEPSGLADPAPIAQAILRNPVLSRVLRLDAIIATADALFIEPQRARHPETRKQLAMADHIVLTKPDLVDPAALQRLEAAIRSDNPIAPIHPATQGILDPARLFPPSFFSPDAPPAIERSARQADQPQAHPPEAHPPEAHPQASHATDTVATVLLAEAPLDWPAFETWFRQIRLTHADQLLRIKGFLNIAGAPGPVIIHGIHHILHPPVQRDTWPDPDHRSRLVLITQGLPPGLLHASWQQALPHLIPNQTLTAST